MDQPSEGSLSVEWCMLHISQDLMLPLAKLVTICQCLLSASLHQHNCGIEHSGCADLSMQVLEQLEEGGQNALLSPRARARARAWAAWARVC